MFEVNNKNTRAMPNLTKKKNTRTFLSFLSLTFDVVLFFFIANFEHISHLFVVLRLLTVTTVEC